jgi:flagellin-specific chaperone FliS
MSQAPTPKAELDEIIQSAQRLGIELDESEALQWLTAMAASEGDQIRVDEKTGIFGHKVSMLDFSDADLAHFRQIGALVEFQDVPGKVETALALSGSAAQSKIQTYPGDADFFERVNIIADTREAACRTLGQIMREKALATRRGDRYNLIEVKMGAYPHNMLRGGQLQAAGSPISWTPEDIEAGLVAGTDEAGQPLVVRWEDAAQQPGWCKLDWIVADTARKTLVNASNMLDVTWEAPDGEIVPLDGYLDGWFQEVYLDADAIPLFSKLVKHVSGDAIEDYIEQLEHEVEKYTTQDPNYGKAAKRLYNIFRLNGRYADAAYLRELFDEPTSMLYQIAALIRTIDEAFQPGSHIDKNTILMQADQLIIAVTSVLEGEKETEIVRQLLNFRSLIVDDLNRGELSPQASAARKEVANIVNNFFYEKLTGVPSIREYLSQFEKPE